MLSEGIAVCIFVVEITSICFMARLGPGFLRMSVYLNLFIISLFGAKLTEMFGLLSNAGNIPYAGVVLAQSVIIEIYGRKEAHKTLFISFIFLIGTFLLVQLSAARPPVAGNEDVFNAITLLATFQAKMVVASVAAFFIGQTVMLKVHEYLQGKKIWTRLLVSMVACQVVDTVIFFPTAFRPMSWNKVVEIGISGLIIKLGSTLLALPVVIGLSWRLRSKGIHQNSFE